METVTRDNYYIAGLVLLRQEHLATISELESADGLTKPQLDLLRTELDDEHGSRCAQEWKAIGSQIKADMDVKIGSTPVHKDMPHSPGPNRLGPSYWRWRG
jgi:hypothetical protein